MKKYNKIMGTNNRSVASTLNNKTNKVCPCCDTMKRENFVKIRQTFYECRNCGCEFDTQTGEITKQGKY